MKRTTAFTTVLLSLLLIGAFAISSCDFVLKHLADLPEGTKENESKGERPRGEASSAPGEGVAAPSVDYEQKRSDRMWEPELFAIPPTETSERESEEPSLLVFSPEEELWVIAKAPAAEERHREKTGAFRTVAATGRMKRAVESQPQMQTEATAVINGIVSSVTISQTFRNARSYPVDIPYQCRLPSNAAVTDFVMTIGERKIRGIVREREEAEEIYELARSRGLLASLIEQEAPSTLRVTITNAAPDEEIDVTVNYVHTLKYADGTLEFMLPLTPPISDSVVVARTAPNGGDESGGEHPDHFSDAHALWEISAEVEVDAGVPIRAVSCPTHMIVTERPGASRARVHMRETCEPGEQALVVRFNLRDSTPAGALFTQKRDDQAYFALTLYPATDAGAAPRVPLDVVFLIDCSKSMKGKAAFRAKQFVTGALEQLEPADAFKIVTFSGSKWPTTEHFAPATAENVRRASRHVAGLPVSDGEGMMPGLEDALVPRRDPNGFPILVVLTHGYIVNDAEVVTYLDGHVAGTRVFSIGIGTSVNTYLLEDLAVVGGGGVVYLSPDNEVTGAATSFINTIGRPVMTDITVDWGGAEIDEVLPRRIPDLFAGRSVLLTGTYRGTLPRTLRVNGRAGGRRVALNVPVDSNEAEIARPGISALWARKRISELIRQAMIDPSTDVLSLGRQLSVEHRIASPFASFIIVDTKSGN